MDKDYSNLIVKIMALILIVIGFIGLKGYVHKREISKLLLEKPIEEKISSNNELKKSKKILLSNISVEENSRTISNSSNEVTKKKHEGKDMISEIEETTENDINRSANTINLDDTLLLARLIMSEAGDEPYLGKLAVGNVVIYRSEEDNVSIEDTIFKKSQFDGVNTDNFNIQPNADSIRAATEVLNGEKAISDGYFFVNLNVASPSWAKTDNFIVRIGDHWFFRKEE